MGKGSARGVVRIYIYKTDMLFLLVLLGLSESAKLRSTMTQLELGNVNIEPALPDEDYIAYDCSTTETRYIKEVCDLCQADFAYAIPEPNVSYLEGYYQEDKDRIEPVLADFSGNTPEAASYGVAINDNYVCLSATAFEEDEDTEELLSYFVGVEAVPIQIPEIFEKAALLIEYISVRSDEDEYDYFSIEYTGESTYVATDSITLYLEYIHNVFENSSGHYVYSGTAQVSGDPLQFTIITDYDREEFEDFAVDIAVDEKYSVAEWDLIFDPDSDCSGVIPPIGISGFFMFSVETASLEYAYSLDQDSMILLFEKMFFALPDFAIAPSIVLHDNTGVLVIEFQVSACGYEVIGTWDYLDYEILLTVYDNNQTSHMEANGYFVDLPSIPVLDIGEYFYEPLFPEDTEMLPTFIPSDPLQLQELKEQSVANPHIQLYFEPGIAYNIYGEGTGSSLEVVSGRVGGVVQTIVHRFSTGPGELEEAGYSKVQNDVMYGSSDIDIEVYFYMASMLDDERTQWYLGVTVEAIIEFNDFCSTNDFCGLLQKYAVTPTGELELRGVVVNDTVSVDYEVLDFLMSASVRFEEVGLSLEHTDYGHLPLFVGAFYLQVDRNTVLRFQGTISQGDDMKSAVLESQSYDVWESVLEEQRLTAAGISLRGTVNKEGQVIASETLATGLIGEVCYDGEVISQECLEGSFDMILDFTDYEDNSFELGLFNLSTADFYNFVGGYEYANNEEILLPQSCLEFPAGIFIQYSYAGTLVFSGDILFCGVFGEASGTTESIGSGVMDWEITLHDFYFASENARMKSSTGYLSVSRENDLSAGSISGSINIWAWETPVVISLNTEFFTEFSGAIYNGIYTYQIQMQGSSSSSKYLTDCTMTMHLSLDPSQAAAQEALLRESLTNWVDSGHSVLQTADEMIAQFTTDLGSLESQLCDPEITCPVSVYCSDSVQEVCVENPIVQNCTGGNGCSNVQLVCTSFEVICVKEDSECQEDCECKSQVEVCKKWESECLVDSDECRDKAIVKDMDVCLKSVHTCVKIEEIEIQCRLRCEWNQDVYEMAEAKYLMFREGYNETQEDLGGFEEIKLMMEQRVDVELLVKIRRIFASEELSEGGIGPNDFEFVADIDIVSIEESQFTEVEVEITWNFYDDTFNQGGLLSGTKGAIIDESGEKLTYELNTKSPKEVMEENIDFS